jgi:rRNA small subunit methyltransferase G
LSGAVPPLPPAVAGALVEVLEEAAGLGFLGPGPVAAHIAHAARFEAALRPTTDVLDLGSGGGVPGLVLAGRRPELAVVLLDARTNRTDFLVRVVARLGWAGRVSVVAGQAESLGRSPQWRGRCSAVVARSFGSPSVTAEDAAPFLAVGGQLLVSQPPAPAPGRWPAAGLALVGLEADEPLAGLASFTQTRPCPERFPRRRQHPPLFGLAGST